MINGHLSLANCRPTILSALNLFRDRTLQTYLSTT